MPQLLLYQFLLGWRGLPQIDHEIRSKPSWPGKVCAEA